VSENVILVDQHDQPIGAMDKMEAHVKGALHRAFSVIVLAGDPEDPMVLLQKRASSKYHFPDLWSNTCCSHPREGETVVQAAHRRLREEIGVELDVAEVGHFTYKAACSSGLIEHEIDHVVVGHSTVDLVCELDPAEVSETRWVRMSELLAALESDPASYTPWFPLALQVLLANQEPVRRAG